MFEKQLDLSEKNLGRDAASVHWIVKFVFYAQCAWLRVCGRFEITLLYEIDLLLSKSRPIILSRVLLFQYTRHANYKSACFNLLTITKSMKADV